MQIDSIEPYTEYIDYATSENRYKILSKVNPENKDELLSKSKQDAENRRKSYIKSKSSQ